jgi:RNA polymerase sigma-70 factor (ECF subfamily)
MSGDRHPGPYERRSDASLLVDDTDPAAAFSELYARHVGTVYEWFRRRLEWAASDLTAETFTRAWLGRRRFRDDRHGSALPWLLGIGANVLADTVRRDRIETSARRRMGLPLDLATEDGYAEVENRLSPSAALEQQLRRLPAHELQALELKMLKDLSYAQVGARLAIRPAAARLRVSRALRRLASTIPKEEQL